jgi:hypothetical protein
MFETVRGWMSATLLGIFSYRKGEDSRNSRAQFKDFVQEFSDEQFQRVSPGKISAQISAHVSTWHKCEVPTGSGNVCCLG